jgi:hypothetical protein
MIRQEGQPLNDGTGVPLSESQHRVSNRCPPLRIDPPRVDGKTLNNDHRGQRVEVDLVNAPIHHPIACHAEPDETVQGKVEEAVVEYKIESANGSVHELATRYEGKAPVVFRLLSPINRHRHARSENDHVAERNRQERIYTFLLEHSNVEASHDHSDSEAHHNHQRGKPGSKPTEQAVYASGRAREPPER